VYSHVTYNAPKTQAKEDVPICYLLTSLLQEERNSLAIQMFGASKCALSHRLVDLVTDAAASTFAAFPEVSQSLFCACSVSYFSFPAIVRGGGRDDCVQGRHRTAPLHGRIRGLCFEKVRKTQIDARGCDHDGEEPNRPQRRRSALLKNVNPLFLSFFRFSSLTEGAVGWIGSGGSARHCFEGG
jgi:hypothetical protein